jgi:protein TonB
MPTQIGANKRRDAMAYLQHTSWRDRPGAIAAVIAIHGLVGYALVTGLSFTQIIGTIDNPDAVDVLVPIEPPPPPKPDTKVEPDPQQMAPKPTAPIPPIDLGPQRPPVDTTPVIIPHLDPMPKVIPSPTPGPLTTPTPRFSPSAARPRNNPGTWVTEADYRSSWINREMIGTARFRLEITPDGRVQNCTITGSSGHAELDAATCQLVTRRARFEAAKDETGARTGGSYASSVRWELPE